MKKDRTLRKLIDFLKGLSPNVFGMCLMLLGTMSMVSCDDEPEDEPTPSPTVLSAPTNVKAVQNGNVIRVSWDYVSKAVRYVVYSRQGSSGEPSMSSTSDTYSTYEPGRKVSGYCYFKVKAVAYDGTESAYSMEVSCMYKPGSTGDGNGDDGNLSAPTGVSARQDGSSVKVSWNSVTAATSYNVYRSGSASGTFSKVGSVSNTSYTDNNPLKGYNYYKVTSVKGSTESDKSAATSVNYSSGNGGGTTTKPSVPTGLRAVQQNQSIVVSWNSVQDVYYYRLWYQRPNDSHEDFTNVYSPSTSAEFDRNMKDGTWTFWIQAVNSDYEASEKSSKVTCTFKGNNGSSGGDETPSKLATPTNLEAYGNSYDSYVQISFDEVELAYEYELYRSSSATSGYTKIPASGGSISGKRYMLTDSNPKSGTSYYKVKAKALSYLGIADSDLSNYVKVTR